MTGRFWRSFHGWAVAAFGLIVLGCAAAERNNRPTVRDARAFYAAQPRFLRPLPHTTVPPGLPDLRAETCGSCHVDIYREWQASAHAHAWKNDPQFTEEMKKTTATPGRDASWICMNCHTPVEAQLPKLVAALEGGDRGRPVYVDNPEYDPRLQDEAVTCATCHVQDGVVIGPFGGSGAPHPVRQSTELQSSTLCTQCHQVNESMADVNLICTFDTGETFAAGPDAAEGKSCQSCHMPEVTRSLTRTATQARPGRHHWFGGSLIPKKPEFEEGLAPLRKIYPDGAKVEWVDLPESLTPGRAATLRFAVTNALAGHTLPTSDVERYLLVTARAVDESGTVLAERTERFGTRYQWFPVAKRLDDTRLLPRETRTFTLEFRTPARGTVRFELLGTNNRMSPENFAWHNLDGRSVRNRVFYEGSETRPVRS